MSRSSDARRRRVAALRVAYASILFAACDGFAGGEVQGGARPGAGDAAASDDGDGEHAAANRDAAAAGADAGAGTPEPVVAALAPLRRLTRLQYRNSVRALLDLEVPSDLALPDDGRAGPFHSNASLRVGDADVELYQLAAEALSALAIERGLPGYACQASDPNPECVDAFLADLALRAYRRPATTEQLQDLRTVFEAGRGLSEPDALRFSLQLVLQSPHFLYLMEATPTDAEATAVDVPLDDYALAARLSYFLWDGPPDAELLELAQQQTLRSPEVLEAQARRLLAAESARRTLTRFHMQWLGLDDFARVVKDPDAFPEFDAELRAAMLVDAERFFAWALEQDGHTIAPLFTAQVGFAEGPLAPIYGLPSPPAALPAQLEGSGRAGVLSLPIVLSRYAHPREPSAVRRGLLVRERLLCGAVPEPPDFVDTSPPEPGAGETNRDATARHASDPLCNSCHRLMDPIGWGFERFDAIGRERSHEAGQPLRAEGEILGSDAAGPFTGLGELGDKLAASEDVQSCVARQWFRFALGRLDGADDEPALREVQAAFVASGGSVHALIAAIVRSRGFTHRAVAPTEAP